MCCEQSLNIAVTVRLLKYRKTNDGVGKLQGMKKQERKLTTKAPGVKKQGVVLSNDCAGDVRVQQKKVSPKDFWQYFPNDCMFFTKILHAFCMFMCTQNCKILFNYL